MVGTITIKKWKAYQHYKHRSPPWIRLHRRILDPRETPWWRELSDGSARFLVELWLLASERDGVVPFDSMMIAWKLGRASTDLPHIRACLSELAGVGAIVLAGTDASASASTNASANASVDF